MTRRQSDRLVEGLAAIQITTILLCLTLFAARLDYYAAVTIVGGIIFAAIHTCHTLRR